MKILMLKGPAGLGVFAKECAKALFSEVPHPFVFPNDCSLHPWPASAIKDSNKVFLGALRNSANVYAIFVRDSGFCSTWKKMYVGQRKSKGLRERITQHLITKDRRTGSVLDRVKAAVALKQEVGLAFIKIEPESLRLFVEERIIEEYKSELEWNRHG